MKLPFLQDNKWPIVREDEEKVVNPSSDKELQDHLVEELLIAMEKKDSAKLRDSLMALIHSIRDEEQNGK